MRRHKATNLHPSQRIVEAISGTYDPPGDPPLMTRIPLLPHQNVFANLPIYPSSPKVVYGVVHKDYAFETQAAIDDPKIWTKSETVGVTGRDTTLSYDTIAGLHLRLRVEAETRARLEVQSTEPSGTIKSDRELWTMAVVSLNGDACVSFGVFEKGLATDIYKAGLGIESRYDPVSETHTFICFCQDGDGRNMAIARTGPAIPNDQPIQLGIHYNKGVVNYHLVQDGTNHYIATYLVDDDKTKAALKDLDVHATCGAYSEDGTVKYYGVRVIDEKQIVDPRYAL